MSIYFDFYTNTMDININYNNIKSNYLKIREYTGLGQYCIPVVKADAYGFGAIDVVKNLLDLDEPQRKYFVFCLDEALKIKEYFRDKITDIYVLCGNLRGEAKTFLDNNFIPVINNFTELYELCDEIKKQGRKNFKIAIQFNTGMNRNGFDIKDIEQVKQFIENTKELTVDMILTHFGCADSIDNRMTQQQINNINILLKYFPKIKKSFCSTSAALNIKNCIYDCVRIGYGMYGSSDTALHLKQALTITGKIYKNNESYYLKFGMNNGIFAHFNEDAYVMVDGKKVHYKKVLKNKLILDLDKNTYTNLRNKTALVVGEDGKNNINIDTFSGFFNSNREEMYCRLLANYSINNYKCKYCKSTIRFNKNKVESCYSKITEIREVENDGWVGYGATNDIKKGDILAVVIGGFADFMPRCLSNNHKVIVKTIKNELIRCLICGRVSMDQFVIRIPKKYKNDVKIYCDVILVDTKKNIHFTKKLHRDEINHMLYNAKRRVSINDTFTFPLT